MWRGCVASTRRTAKRTWRGSASAPADCRFRRSLAPGVHAPGRLEATLEALLHEIGHHPRAYADLVPQAATLPDPQRVAALGNDVAAYTASPRSGRVERSGPAGGGGPTARAVSALARLC